MSEPLLPDVLWAVVAPLLPPEPPKPRGGHRRLPVRACLSGIRFVLKSGMPFESSQRLGRHRWVIERTLAWLTRYRRLTIRSERRTDIHQAFLTLGCALSCFNH